MLGLFEKGWIEDYLIDRPQRVNYNNLECERKLINHGVPQGTILGPLLYILL